MNGNKKLVTVRLDDTLYQKLKYISKIEYRSLSNQIMRFSRQAVEQYEAENGEIVVSETAK